MIDLSQDIHSLSDFKRKTTEFLARMKKSGHPVVLTINGKAELVVQDAASYQRLLALAERAEMMECLRASRGDIDEALQWITQRSRAAAVRWHQQLLQAVRSLEDNPERCGLAPESAWYPG